jgi:hypothetical protein
MLLSLSLMANAILIAITVAWSRSDQGPLASPARPDAARFASVQTLPVAGATTVSPVVGTATVSTPHTTTPRQTDAVPTGASPVRSRPTSLARPAHGSSTRSNQSRQHPRPHHSRPTVARKTLAAVERKVLALVVESPEGKLPPSLIDPTTGLAENNIQAVCRARTRRSLLCVVRPGQHNPGEGLFVAYRLNESGRGVYTWYGYRNG